MKPKDIINYPLREVGGTIKIGILLAGALAALGCENYKEKPIAKEPEIRYIAELPEPNIYY